MLIIPSQFNRRSFSYQTTVARMRGEFMFPVSAAVREQASVAAGDHVDVEIELDTTPREVTIPTDLAHALQQHPDANQAFEKLSYTNGSDTFSQSRAPRQPRPGNAGSRRPWKNYRPSSERHPFSIATPPASAVISGSSGRA